MLAGGAHGRILGLGRSVAAGTQNGFNTGVCQYETQVYVGHRRVHRNGRGRVQ